MKNPLVSGNEAAQIDKAVRRLLAEFRGLEPPLSLDLVREQLELDREYYSSKDPSQLRQVVHAIKVGVKRVFKRPMVLADAIRTLDLRALFFVQQKKILIDTELPKLKHRWTEGHEIGHSLAWWHEDYLLGDSDNELSPACHATIEAEANYACGQLLFLQDRFVDEAMSRPVSMESIKSLKEIFGNTWTSTLWRFVEQYRGSEPLVGIVCVHPLRLPQTFDSTAPCKYVIQSPSFRKMFSSVDETTLFNAIRQYCGPQRGGPLGSGEVILQDTNGQPHSFSFQTHSNTYEALTLGICRVKLPRPRPVRISAS